MDTSKEYTKLYKRNQMVLCFFNKHTPLPPKSLAKTITRLLRLNEGAVHGGDRRHQHYPLPRCLEREGDQGGH